MAKQVMGMYGPVMLTTRKTRPAGPRAQAKARKLYQETHPYHCADCRGLWREDELMSGNRCPACGQPMTTSPNANKG